MLIKLAIKNTFRNFKRTVITLVSLVLGTFLVIFSQAFVNGVDNSISALQVKTKFSHLLITAKHYERSPLEAPLENLIEAPDQLMTKLQKFNFVRNVAARTYFEVELNDGRERLNTLGLVMDPVIDERVFHFAKYTSGKSLLANPQGMIMGRDLAKAFGKKIGDPLTLIARSKFSSYTALDTNITGLLNCSNPEFDNNSIIISRAAAADFLQLGQAVSEIYLETDDLNKCQAYKTEIQKILPPGLKIESWWDKTEDLRNLNKIRRTAFKLVITIIMLIATVGIANTILMATYERRKEIGVLAALGFSKSRIRQLFLLEAGFIGLIGSTLGALLGTVVVTRFAQNGLDLSRTLSDSGGSYPLSVIYFVFDYRLILFAFLLGLVIAVFAALYPANKIAQLNICTALRSE